MSWNACSRTSSWSPNITDGNEAADMLAKEGAKLENKKIENRGVSLLSLFLDCLVL
jgi:hypothetical protein